MRTKRHRQFRNKFGLADSFRQSWFFYVLVATTNCFFRLLVRFHRNTKFETRCFASLCWFHRGAKFKSARFFFHFLGWIDHRAKLEPARFICFFGCSDNGAKFKSCGRGFYFLASERKWLCRLIGRNGDGRIRSKLDTRLCRMDTKFVIRNR